VYCRSRLFGPKRVYDRLGLVFMGGLVFINQGLGIRNGAKKAVLINHPLRLRRKGRRVLVVVFCALYVLR